MFAKDYLKLHWRIPNFNKVDGWRPESLNRDSCTKVFL